MNDADIRKAVDSRLRELRKLTEQSAWIEQQTSQAMLALTSLVSILKDEHKQKEVRQAIEAARRKPAGLTETISECLRATHSSLSASEVRYWLGREGFDLSEYSQPLTTISITLRRLAERGRVKAIRKDRNVTYKWIGD